MSDSLNTLPRLSARAQAELAAYERRLAETERKRQEKLAALSDPLYTILRDLARAYGVAYRYGVAHGQPDVAALASAQRGALDTIASLRGWNFPGLDETRGRPRQG